MLGAKRQQWGKAKGGNPNVTQYISSQINDKLKASALKYKAGKKSLDHLHFLFFANLIFNFYFKRERESLGRSSNFTANFYTQRDS